MMLFLGLSPSESVPCQDCAEPRVACICNQLEFDDISPQLEARRLYDPTAPD